MIFTKKTICLVVALVFGFSSSRSSASTQLSRVTFDAGSLVDEFGFVSPTWFYTPGTPTYPAGYINNSVRTSHNDDDGGGDLVYRLPAGFPATNEVYISYWVKYEAGYWGNYSGIWNVKIMSSPVGTGPHTELIWQAYDEDDHTMGFSWQMENGMSWDNDDTVTKYANVPYVMGDWLHVEIYMKKSTGLTFENMDGVAWAKFNGSLAFEDNAIITGDFTRPLDAPSIKGTIECLPGEGWWQLDDYEVWDGLPEEDVVAPVAPANLAVR